MRLTSVCLSGVTRDSSGVNKTNEAYICLLVRSHTGLWWSELDQWGLHLFACQESHGTLVEWTRPMRLTSVCLSGVTQDSGGMNLTHEASNCLLVRSHTGLWRSELDPWGLHLFACQESHGTLVEWTRPMRLTSVCLSGVTRDSGGVNKTNEAYICLLVRSHTGLWRNELDPWGFQLFACQESHRTLEEWTGPMRLPSVCLSGVTRDSGGVN